MKDGSKVKVVNDVMVDEPRFLNVKMPAQKGHVRYRTTTVLRDTGRGDGIVKTNLVREKELTGKPSLVYLIDVTVRELPETQIIVMMPHLRGKSNAVHG